MRAECGVGSWQSLCGSRTFFACNGRERLRIDPGQRAARLLPPPESTVPTSMSASERLLEPEEQPCVDTESTATTKALANLLVDMDTNTFPEIVLFSRAGCSINGTPWRPLPQLRLLPGKVATRQPGNSVSGRAFRLPVSRLHGRWHESSWRWRWGHAEASSAQTQGSVIPRAPGRPPGRPFTHSLFERRARRRERSPPDRSATDEQRSAPQRQRTGHHWAIFPNAGPLQSPPQSGVQADVGAGAVQSVVLGDAISRVALSVSRKAPPKPNMTPGSARGGRPEAL